MLSPGLGGEALRDTKCLAEKFTPLCHRLGIYPCVRVSGQRFLPKIAAETSYERLPEQVFLEIANGAEKNLRDPGRLTHHLLRAIRLINSSEILVNYKCALGRSLCSHWDHHSRLIHNRVLLIMVVSLSLYKLSLVLGLAYCSLNTAGVLPEVGPEDLTDLVFLIGV